MILNEITTAATLASSEMVLEKSSAFNPTKMVISTLVGIGIICVQDLVNIRKIMARTSSWVGIYRISVMGMECKISIVGYILGSGRMIRNMDRG